MTELKTFRKINNLTQTEIGEYLGIKKAFVSSIENGKARLPVEKFNKLINNDRGWDITPLTSESTYLNGIHDNANDGDSQKTVSVLRLIEAIREAHSLNAKSQEQIDRLISIIETLTKTQ